MSPLRERSRVFKPWLWFPSQIAHDFSPLVLPFLSQFSPCLNKEFKPLLWRDLSFPNPLGIAGGVDKNGSGLSAWSRLGAGFLEVGTVTPEPQTSNPGQIMARDIPHKALWNKMGFPNKGADALRKNLANQKLDVPLFINIGKNRWTDNSKAADDYAVCVQKLSPFASCFVINLSSPNTKGLRDLLSREVLEPFLAELRDKCVSFSNQRPFLLKLSPDMDRESFKMIFEVSAPYVDGWILTNTTRQRYEHSPFEAGAGGVSGQPLCKLSREALDMAGDYKKRFPEKLLVSVGGVLSSSEVNHRLERGADLVQFYSALVFEGPFFFKKILKSLQ